MENSKRLIVTMRLQEIIWSVYLAVRIFFSIYHFSDWNIVVSAAISFVGAAVIYYGCSNIWVRRGFITMSFMCCLALSDVLGLPLFAVFGRSGVFATLFFSGVFAFALTALLMIYGFINETVVVKKKLKLTSPKLKRNYKIAVMSDIHFDTVQSPRVLERVVERINAEAPDVVILVGDIADGKTPQSRLPQLFETLGALKSEYGTLFVHGNHDRKLGDEFARQMKEAGIRCIDDEAFGIGNDLCIIGRNDYTVSKRKSASELLSDMDASRFNIIAQHKDDDCEELAAGKVELCVAGHTHGAQNLPNNLLYALAGMRYYGRYQIGGMLLYITAGVAGSQYPLRTHAHGEYIIFELFGADAK